MKIRSFVFALVMVGVFGLASCANEKDKDLKSESEKVLKTASIPTFNADSAHFFVQKQVSFGPRIPNSKAHQKTGDYLVHELKKRGAIVVEQHFSGTTYSNQKLNLRNVIASFYPTKKKRILLAAHWDTRPFADKDPEKPNSTFDGANDGASGVGVLLEIARLIRADSLLNVGVDIIFFDGEDWGESGDQQRETPLPKNLSDWWCLGSQHWSKNKHQANYTASYGILIDMVGGKNAHFAKESYSVEYAPSVVDKVWSTASRLGYSHIFLQEKTGFITDDHRFVNELGKIPMIDIISYDPTTSFGDFHHTRKDNMEIISKETLRVVGTTVLHVIYNE
ncbi:MAG TPA: M28 family peptidase [Cyclobacteriaceae bacterium]|nr:M28 family peptidase [Cyclobacteriaceae bacterium]